MTNWRWFEMLHHWTDSHLTNHNYSTVSSIHHYSPYTFVVAFSRIQKAIAMHQSTSSRLSPITSTDSRNAPDERRTLYSAHYNAPSGSTPIPANALAINAEIAGEMQRRREARRKQIINVSIVILGIVMITLWVTWLLVWVTRKHKRTTKLDANGVASDNNIAASERKDPLKSVAGISAPLPDINALPWGVPQGWWRKGPDSKWYYYRLIGPSVPYKPKKQKVKQNGKNTLNTNNHTARKPPLIQKQS